MFGLMQKQHSMSFCLQNLTKVSPFHLSEVLLMDKANLHKHQKKKKKNSCHNIEIFLKCFPFVFCFLSESLLSISALTFLSSSLPSKDTGPSLLGSLSLSSSSPSPAYYSEAKTVSGGSLLNGPLSYSQSSDVIKVRT